MLGHGLGVDGRYRVALEHRWTEAGDMDTSGMTVESEPACGLFPVFCTRAPSMPWVHLVHGGHVAHIRRTNW